MGVALPAHGAHDLNGQRGDTVGQNAESVLLALGVEDLEAGNGDDTGLDVVLLSELLGGVNADADLGTGRDEGNLGTLNLAQDVTTLDGALNGRALQLGKVLAGQSHDAGSVLGGKGNVVGGAGLVTVGRAPDHAVGQSTEVGQSLDRLVGRTVLTKTDGVVGGDPDGADLGQSRQTDSTGGVRDEVQEGTTVGDQRAVGSDTVHDTTHTVLTDTVADVATGVVTETSGGGLEVDGVLPPGQVGTGQIGGTTNELGNDSSELGKDGLGELSRSDGGVLGGVDGEGLLPASGQVTSLAADEVVVLGLELVAVLGEQLVPLSLGGGTGGRNLAVSIVDLLGNGEALLGVEAELLLELLDVVGLEGRAVDTVGALLLGAETNGGLQLDDGGLVLALLGLGNGLLNAVEVVVTVADDEDLPAVRLVSLDNVLSEGAVGVTVNGDVVVVVDGNQVAELEVTSQGRGLGGDTLHQATVTEEAVCVVVDKVEVLLVEGGASLSLGNGKTNSVGDTLSEGTSGDLDTRGVVGLGVTRGDAVNGLECCQIDGFFSDPQMQSSSVSTYSESLDVIHGDGVAEQVEEGILKHAAVAVAI